MFAPGAFRTPINRAAWSTPEAYRSLMSLVPYKRIGEPEDIAQAVVWPASDQSDYVVGATLFVDGGMTFFPDFAASGWCRRPAASPRASSGPGFEGPTPRAG